MGHTRRDFIAGGAALGAMGAIGAAGLSGCTDEQKRTIDKAGGLPAAGSSLNDVEHIVILMQENRSFDHYFGTLSGVRGFSDPAAHGGGAVFTQRGYRPGTGPDAGGHLQPFRLREHPPSQKGQTVNDISHTWLVQHRSWNNGAMDSFVKAHVAGDGPQDSPLTMGYYTRADLPFYYALADAFTVCDGYHCSMLGPTDPNRIMFLSGTIDPEGARGGPVIVTRLKDRVKHYGTLSWETMPERLLDAGVSWKVYNDGIGRLAFNPLPYFKAYSSPKSLRGLHLVEHALTPGYPSTFASDVKKGKLPSVSWIMPPLSGSEHPASPPENGEHLVSQILATLTSNPDVWARTVFLVVYDENGGFFDHVPPVTAPPGTEGEYLTAKPLPAGAFGIAGPIGLGFRTPALVISPYSRGGHVYSGTLDHTSVLRLIETRFKVEVPNLSAWRRKVTGDFTGALRFTAPDMTVPKLPETGTLGNSKTQTQAVLDALAGKPGGGNSYPVPSRNAMPAQEAGPDRPPLT